MVVSRFTLPLVIDPIVASLTAKCIRQRLAPVV
jgi:hypothetical protein